MKKLIIGIMFLMSACTNPNDAMRALEAEGFSNIKITGYNWLACSKDDFYSTGFEATNSKGKVVSGTVCSGVLFKNATIRF